MRISTEPKYVISDDSIVLVASENFGETGHPSSGTGGNRGWGAVAESPALASYFGEIFDHDSGGGWVTEMAGAKGAESYSVAEAKTGNFLPKSFEGASVTLVISPDTSYLVGDLISSAKESVCIEQAYIKNWSSGENPWLEDAIDAARRGANVRIILDSYYYNIEGDDDNDEMAQYINAVASSGSLPLEARLISLESGYLDKVHNKGVIVDGRQVLVSSINWNENSPSYNREAGLIIDHSGAAGYFTEVFYSDWDSSAPADPSTGHIGDVSGSSQTDELRNYIAAGVIFLFAALYVVKKKRF
ncbi:phospholipase D-like domain-containing protein [Methanolacinia petrolearia]|uniref:phospholipase D-like domain-containing protein n=1 Tax=Methanolacinia petrolearia TaxID=54120 RepID=UPI003BAB6F43